MKLVRALLWIGGIAAVIAAILRATILDLWIVPPGEGDAPFALSLLPQLRPGDAVLLLTRGKLGRGDLVRCPDPTSEGRWVVGRIMAELNDRVQIDAGGLKINQRRVPTALGCPPVTVNDPTTNLEHKLPCAVEDYEGRRYPRVTGPNADLRNSPIDTTMQSSGEVYLLSDDRYFHDDSRDFGPVPKASCSGRIVFRLWSDEGWMDADHRFTFID